jgi:hypothetical protein
MPVTKILRITEEMDAAIKHEIESRPALYRTELNRISEAELIRRAIAFYLAPLATPSDKEHAQ